MTWLRLVRGELRKLTTTKLPWGFLAVLAVIAGIDAAVVMFGTDMDGSKGFIATAADQQSLMAFAFNAMMGTALFGAIAVAREYGHDTVVPTFLTTPRRAPAVLAQLDRRSHRWWGARAPRRGAHHRRGRPRRCRAPSTASWSRPVASPSSSRPRRSPGRGCRPRRRSRRPDPQPGRRGHRGDDGALRHPAARRPADPRSGRLGAERPGLVISGVAPEPGVAMALVAVALWALVPAVAGLVSVLRRDIV